MAGSAARGSRALTALTDIVLDLRRPGSDPFSRRRLLYGVGGYAETPQRLLLKMNAEGTAYDVLADSDADAAAFAPALDTLRDLLGRAAGPLTRQEILERWGNDLTRPTANALWRWLTRGCEAGVLVRHGDGSRTDPFRYTLAAAAATATPAVAAASAGDPMPAPSPGGAAALAPAETGLPPAAPAPAARSFASLAPAPAQDAPAARPVARQPVLPVDAPLPGGCEEDAAVVAPPAQASVPAEPAPAAGPVSDSRPEESAAAPPPAPGSGMLPDLPPHARWLLGLMAPAPPQPDQAG